MAGSVHPSGTQNYVLGCEPVTSDYPVCFLRDAAPVKFCFWLRNIQLPPPRGLSWNMTSNSLDGQNSSANISVPNTEEK